MTERTAIDTIVAIAAWFLVIGATLGLLGAAFLAGSREKDRDSRKFFLTLLGAAAQFIAAGRVLGWW